MGTLHISHIKAALKKRFSDLIDLSDLPQKILETEKENFFLSRALSAFVVAELASIDDKIAVKAVVDGSRDNGIDAFYFDQKEQVCYLIQSKWIHNGKGSVELGEMHKFLQGVQDLLEFKLERFNKLQLMKTEIQTVLSDPQTTFVLVVAYTGEQEISNESRRPLDDFLEEQNDPSELISFRPLRQKDLHSIVAKKATGDSVNLTVQLHEWGMITEPYLAYYGQIDLEDIGNWKEFGQSLYHRNLRGFKGNTDVNEDIVRTAVFTPHHFWYFNNGITILCDKMSKLPIGGNSRAVGTFELIGASVVNGAQTVGSIISATGNKSNKNKSAQVLIRLISLDNCPPEFASDLTRATNTQNRIEKKDFASLDPEQERLKTEMFLQYGKIYSYRTGDRELSLDEGCTLDEATIALACAQEDTNLCVQAKREVSKLYDDIQKVPYKLLFNNTVSPIRLWRSVEVLRIVDSALKNTFDLEGKDRLIAIHGNRFILNRVFQRIKDLDDVSVNFEDVKETLPHIIKDVSEKTIRAKEELYGTSYAANLFKSPNKCKELAKKIQDFGSVPL